MSGTNQKGRLRYRHQEGVRCGCARRSVSLADVESDFRRLIDLLAVSEEAEELMLKLAVEQRKGRLEDEQELEERKNREIAKLRSGIEAAKKMALTGDMTYEEYAEIKAENERGIARWEARTSDIQEKALELNSCANALRRIQSLWDDADGEQRQTLARGLFEYIVYDLDQQRITAFRLHGWADHYLELRGKLYEDGDFVRSGAIDDPNGIRTRRIIITLCYSMAA